MKMGVKLAITVGVAVLTMPVHGFAAEQTATPNPVGTAHACKVRGKKISAAAVEMRKKIHAAKALVAGDEKIAVNKEAALKHGKYKSVSEATAKDLVQR